MNRLCAYIRRVVTEAARENAEYERSNGFKSREARRRGLESAFRDASHGTNTGWWSDLIYTQDVLALANRHRADIRAAVRDYMRETGEGGDAPIGDFRAVDVIAATAERRTMDDYHGDNGAAREAEAEALCAGLHFAVEYLLSAVAADMGVDL